MERLADLRSSDVSPGSGQTSQYKCVSRGQSYANPAGIPIAVAKLGYISGSDEGPVINQVKSTVNAVIGAIIGSGVVRGIESVVLDW
jgi:hypothetical protein